LEAKVTGVLFHETAQVWQWDGQGHANGGLVEGIADFVLLKAGYDCAAAVAGLQGHLRVIVVE
jgi:hypothetical protein